MENLKTKGWQIRRLDQLGFVGRGKSKHRPRNDPSLYGGQYPFVQTGDVKAAELYISAYSQTYNERGLSQSKLWDPGTLCITIAANIADTAILKIKACFPDSIVGFVADPEKADVRFVKYYIDTVKPRMQNASRGTTQDNLSIDKLLTFDFLLPPIQIQRRVASILSVYDDLIENNARRIAILEEMARRLYEEWFVRFLFPGHTKVKMLESKIGLTPKGWEIVTVPQVIEIDPQTIVPRNGLKPFVPMSSISETDMLITDIEEREGNSGSKFRNGDTLFARITPCLENGKTGFVNFLPADDDVAFGSTEFIVLRSKAVTPEYVYLLARSDNFRDHAIKSMSGATGRQRVKAECFNEFHIALPTKETLELFTDTVAPMFRAIRNYGLKIQNLRTTRDLLLPNLISGEIDVSHFPAPEPATI